MKEKKMVGTANKSIVSSEGVTFSEGFLKWSSSFEITTPLVRHPKLSTGNMWILDWVALSFLLKTAAK